MKFAANGTLYRGSKPVMWSVVEKTALAEAEVEYEDYSRDTVWVKFPVATGHAHREDDARDDIATRRSLGSGSDRDLDHHAVDDARQPRDQLLAEDRLRPLSSHRRADGQLGEGRRPAACWPTSSPPTCSSRRASPAYERLARRVGRRCCDDVVCTHPLEGLAAATISTSRCLPAITSPTTPAPASCTPRRATAARTSTSGPRTRASSTRAASTPPSPTRSTTTAASPSRRRLHRQARASTTRARRATPTRR